MTKHQNSNEETAVQESRECAVTECGPTYVPAADIRSSETGFELHLDVPGVSEESVQVDVKDHILQVKARVDTVAPEGMKALYREFDGGDYERSFRLPTDVASDRIAARLKDGVLTLTVPKSESAQPRRIDVRTD